MSNAPYNGRAPFVAGSDTSEAAANSIQVDSGAVREQVLAFIRASGPNGVTDDEVEVALGLRHQTASARRRELVLKSLVRDSERRRPTRSGRGAVIWVVRDAPPFTPPPVLPPEPPEKMTNQSSLFLATTIDPAGEEGLAPLRKRCLSCTKCELSKTRTNVVFGDGNPNQPLVCFVGEAPGRREDEEGRPFVGRAGEKLTQMIVGMGFGRDEVYICNAVNCRPPDNRPPQKNELEACHEFLLGQIRAVRPKTLVALGASAVAAMIGGKKKISEIRGKWQQWEGIPLMPTFHPSYLLRLEGSANERDMKKLAWGDLLLVLAKLGRPRPGS